MRSNPPRIALLLIWNKNSDQTMIPRLVLRRKASSDDVWERGARVRDCEILAGERGTEQATDECDGGIELVSPVRMPITK